MVLHARFGPEPVTSPDVIGTQARAIQQNE
jgi:hypothetical protein